ncbi:hypothetical protein [Rhodococcus jostii]|uniref:hypothetical protein n=1 Tax=Rhodococcus jostii TaxID=132919 RepID=UPI0011D13AF8|nr:hypothetical protein [Rhodococcus jostii]
MGRMGWLWKSAVVGSAVAIPIGGLVGIQCGKFILALIATLIVEYSMIVGAIAIRGGPHPEYDQDQVEDSDSDA